MAKSVRARVKELTQKVLSEATESPCKRGPAASKGPPFFMLLEDVQRMVTERWRKEEGEEQLERAVMEIARLVFFSQDNDPDFVWKDCRDPVGVMMRNANV